MVRTRPSVVRPWVPWLMSGTIHVAIAALLVGILAGVAKRDAVDVDPLTLAVTMVPSLPATRPTPAAQAPTIEVEAPPSDSLVSVVVAPPVPQVPVDEDPVEAAERQAPGLASSADRELPLFVGVGRRPRPAPAAPAESPGAAPASSLAASPAPALATSQPTVRIPPDYPASARRRGLEGDVILVIDIAADGTPSAVMVDRSSGHRVLDACALAAVRRWRFPPQSVAVARTRVTISFRLT